MTAPPIDNSAAIVDLQEFTRWALESLGISIDPGEDDVWTASIPQDQQAQWGSGDSLRIAFSPTQADDSTKLVTPESPFLRQLIDKVKDSRGLPHAAPRQQPASVREVTQRLFEPYHVEGGSAHLGGCTLEDHALLRITYLERSPAGDQPPRLVHRFTGLTGEPLEPAVAAGLNLDQLRPFEPAAAVSSEQSRRWTEVAFDSFQSIEAAGESQLLLVTAVWCKFAEGKLSFVIGDSTAGVAFSGWAELLANGSVKPPPLECSATGKSSYHLTLTADGEIAPEDAIATCSQSGRRVLETQLERCAATGGLAMQEYLTVCPVSGERVLQAALATCDICQQKVNPLTIRGRICSACRALQRVSKDDPRMARVLGEYPNLDRWGKWRLAETSSIYVLTAGKLIRRLLVVLDRDSLEVRRLASGSRFSKRWDECPDVDRDELLHRDS